MQGVNLFSERDYKSVLIVKCAALCGEHAGYFKWEWFILSSIKSKYDERLSLDFTCWEHGEFLLWFCILVSDLESPQPSSILNALDGITHHSHQKYSVHNEGDKNYETLQVSQGYIRLC